jgi:FkbM family methyltransferase
VRYGLQIRHHPGIRRVQLLKHHRIDLVLDVGAARGQTGEELRRFGYSGPIVSFEPLAVPFALLEKAARNDQAWTVRQVALSDVSGTAVINVSGNSDSSSLLPIQNRTVLAAAKARYVGVQPINVERLDDIATEVLQDSTRPFLKVDVQGLERQVLAGAAETLHRIHGLQLELSFIDLYRGGMLIHEALDVARSAGFILCGINPGFMDRASGELLQADGLFMRSG